MATHDAATRDNGSRRTETDLLLRLRAGDKAAFEQLVREHSGKLLAVARRFLHNDEDARDALQDAFLSAFKAIHEFDGDSRLATWLHRITVNSCLMKLRKKKARPERSIDELLPTFLADGHQANPPAEWPESSETILQRSETREFVRACIDRLPENHRTILLLRDIEEVDTEGAARMLGVTTNVVKTRLHRARQALRTLLDPFVRGDAV